MSTYTDIDTQLLFLSYKEWALERGYVADEATFEKLGDYVHAHGGFEPPISLWDRAVVELGVKVKKLAQPIAIDDEFRASVQNMSSSELLKRLQREPDFQAKFDQLAQQDASPAVDNDPYKNFTARDWRSLPPNTLARLMSQRAFRARVDHIVAHGDQNGERI